MPASLTGDLTKDEVAPGQGCQDESGPNLGAGEVRERKRHDNHIAAYKSRHASSSSGVFQSAAQVVCARGRRFSRPSAWASCRAFKKARKSKTSRCTVSGA